MKVTPQQKILAAVLVVGAIALSADRLLFLNSSASADTTPAASEYALPAATPTAAVSAGARLSPAPQLPAAPAPAASIAQRLRDAAKAAPTTGGDAFAFGECWRQAEPAAAAPDNSGTLAAEQFKTTHHLTGVLTGNGRPVAMIDGRIVPVGQSIDGYRLVDVSHRSATFELGQTQVTLPMSERATSIAGAAQ
ncbi:MAG TPA: hypothetical protein VG742_15175 [Dongiaceae bacterium]|nr:hypothetical protein [Dongiaceae bacterium]